MKCLDCENELKKMKYQYVCYKCNITFMTLTSEKLIKIGKFRIYKKTKNEKLIKQN